MPRHKFLATIYKIWMMRHVDVPEEISPALANELHSGIPRRSGRDGARAGTEAAEAAKSTAPKPKYIPVIAIVNGRSARATLVPAGPGRYRLQLITALRKAAQADTGDAVAVELRGRNRTHDPSFSHSGRATGSQTAVLTGQRDDLLGELIFVAWPRG